MLRGAPAKIVGHGCGEQEERCHINQTMRGRWAQLVEVVRPLVWFMETTIHVASSSYIWSEGYATRVKIASIPTT